MGFARKMRRKNHIDNLKQKGIYCCGKPMIYKTLEHNEKLYFCETCFKEKIIKENEVTENE